MTPLSGFSIISTCLILSCLIGVVVADSGQYDKSICIHMNIDNGKITTTSAEMYYGSAPHLSPIQEGFKGELVAADGSTINTFTVWDPRIQFGDRIAGNYDPRIQNIVERQNSADFVITVPFDKKLSEVRLYDPSEKTVIASVNLKPQIDSFFASYPSDPDNPVSFGLKAPAMINPLQTVTRDPVGNPTGQLGGILTIISGAVLILTGGFASVRFLKNRPRSVLIVDDNPDIIDVIAGMLRMGEYATRSATSGEECLKELESAVHDIILLDIGMKPIDGWETLRRIKKNKATRHIPVIMLTALQLTPKDVEDYGICIEDYVVKPVTFHDLNDAIKHVFARQQMIREKIAAAKGAGIDHNELCECARLTRVVDVNKRLWDQLVRSYNVEGGVGVPDNEITLAIKNTERKIREQEHRLEQIHRNIGSGARG